MGPLHRFNECRLFQQEEMTQMGNWPLVSQARPATEKKEEKKKNKKGNIHDTSPFMKLPKITSLSPCTINVQYVANIPYICKMSVKCGYISFFPQDFFIWAS